MIFLTMTNASSNRRIKHEWQHSGSTISLAIHDVASAIRKCHTRLITKPREGDPVHPKILSSNKYWPWFRDCIGAWDGTHIPAIVSGEDAPLFRNRKGFTSQNVLLGCNFDLEAFGIYAGWEGCAHDSRMFHRARTKPSWPRVDGKFSLVDGGLPNTAESLGPYRGVRYHLREFGSGNRAPQNREELFNLRHAELRNAIERLNGNVKKRFPMLQSMTSYPIAFQVSIVICCVLTNNFIVKHQRLHGGDEDFHDAFLEVDVNEQEQAQIHQHDEQAVNDWRDQIAQQMWDAYVAERDRRAAQRAARR